MLKSLRKYLENVPSFHVFFLKNFQNIIIHYLFELKRILFFSSKLYSIKINYLLRIMINGLDNFIFVILFYLNMDKRHILS